MEKIQCVERYGRIYKIISNQTQKIYIGSTILPINFRFGQHKDKWRGYLNKSKGATYLSSFEIIQYDDAQVILIEEYENIIRKELRIREQYWIENTENCCNIKKAIIIK